MGRDKTKTTQLNLDYAANIHKLSEGNLKWFYEKYIRGDIPQLEFYRAMKWMEDITPQVEQVIDEAYFEALMSLGLTHDQLAEIPKYKRMISDIQQKLEYFVSDNKPFTKEDAVKILREIKFYNGLFNEGHISIKEKKRAKSL